jgi:hypothetical protein
VPPFLNPRLFNDDTIQLDPTLFPYMPNARLGIALTELNRKRIYRKPAAGPDFAANEKELLAKLLECRTSDHPDRQDVGAIEEQLRAENAARLKRLGLLPDDAKKSRNDMPELMFARELAEIDWIAKRAGVDRSDWSMALERNSLSFFDGILGGVSRGKSYYLKEDMILELLSHLQEREPVFRKYFATRHVFELLDYPFGLRLDIGKAAKSCSVLGRLLVGQRLRSPAS